MLGIEQLQCSTVYRLCQSDCEYLLRLTADLYSRPEGLGWRPQLLETLRQAIPFEFAGCHVLQPCARRMLSACYSPLKPSMPSSNDGFWNAVQTHPLNTVLFTHPERAWMGPRNDDRLVLGVGFGELNLPLEQRRNSIEYAQDL